MLSRDYKGVPPSAGPPVYPKQRGIHPIGHLQWNWMLSIIDDGAVSLVKLQKLKKTTGFDHAKINELQSKC